MYKAIFLALAFACWPLEVRPQSLRQSPSQVAERLVGGNMVECRSGSELAKAFADTRIEFAVVLNDITLSASDFAAPVSLDRNFTVLGGYTDKHEWPVLDLGFVKNMVTLGAGVMYNTSRVILVGVRKGPYFQLTGVDLVTFTPRNTSQPYGLVVAWNCASIQRTCLPDSLYMASSSSLKRPAELPGVQLAGRMQQWQPCRNDSSARPLERCWPRMGIYKDIAMYGTDLVGSATPAYNNYILWMYQVNYLCPTVMSDACVSDHGVLGCYYVMFPDNDVAANAITAATGGAVNGSTAATAGEDVSQSDNGKSLLAPLLGGLLGGLGALVVLAAVVVMVKRRRVFGQAMDVDANKDDPSTKRPTLRLCVSSNKDAFAASGTRSSSCCDVHTGRAASADAGRCPAGARISSEQHPRSIHVTQLCDSTTSISVSPGRGPDVGGAPLSLKEAALVCGGGGCALQQEGSEPSSSTAMGMGTGPLCSSRRLMRRSSGLQSGATSSDAGPADGERSRPCRTDDLIGEPVTSQTPMQQDVKLGLDLQKGEVQLSGVVLGKGSFGRVVEGVYGNTRVAVKLLNAGLMMNMPAATAKHRGENAGDGDGAVPAGSDNPAGNRDMENPSGGDHGVSKACAATSLAALAQEVEVLARCQHPNIVRLLAACLEPPQVCLVMELMETSLEKWMYGGSIGRQLELPMVLHVGMQIARALSYLHPTILHRDLKPANVLISQADCDRPIVKLADFGLSRLHNTVLVTKNPEVGTAPYMAPETYDLENQIVTDRVDIYAFGVILWEMLSGKRPWEGQGVVQIAYSVVIQGLRLPLDDLSERRCPPKLRSVIMECWDADPVRRPAAAEIYKALALQQQQERGLLETGLLQVVSNPSGKDLPCVRQTTYLRVAFP